MRIESSVTSISWIPSEAVEGLVTKATFELGVAHYDPPPPAEAPDLEQLRREDRFRFANQLQAYIEVEDGRIVGHGQAGRGLIGSTSMQLLGRRATFEAAALPDIRPAAEVTQDRVRFLQTAGGRTGAPLPRRVSRPPYLQLRAPLAWTTLALTIFADGRSEGELVGASPFPRHWIYDGQGRLGQKSGQIDYKTWTLRSFGRHTPWGDRDSPAVVAEVESALERELSSRVMEGSPSQRRVPRGGVLTRQGDEASELYLLLDGILKVVVDDKPVAEVGPGALLGERAVLNQGIRTATLTAVTPCRVAVVPADRIRREQLEAVAQGHRREGVKGPG
ncbi:MAG: cyclic nucleotide-binding domain-containing protein [Candidatus Dormibacteria bacterium]